jgi:ribosomal protein S18 acetylase RimI-like enzyme
MGSRLVKEAMKTLKEKKCEVACLNANARDYPSSGLYRKVGFRLMQRPISFTDVKLIAERFHLLESTTSFREVEK